MTIKLSPSQDETTVTFDRPVVLFVEGGDDQALAAQQIRRFATGDDWHIVSVTGVGADWVLWVEFALESTEFATNGRAIGVLLDADTDASAAADKARSIFARAGLSIPDDHAQVTTSGELKTGYFVMPDGVSRGALEDLVLQSIPGSRLDLAREYIDEVSKTIEAPKNPSKAIIQAYLAGQVKTVKTLPVALNRDEVIPPDHSVYAPLRDFLASLAAP